MKKQLPVFESEDECRDYLEMLRWPNGIQSPFDPFSKVYVCKDERFRCRNTGKYFNVKTGTLFSNSRLSLVQWTNLLNQVWQGKLEPKQISADFGMSLKSAYLIYHKLNKIVASHEKSIPPAEQFTLTDWLFQLKN